MGKALVPLGLTLFGHLGHPRGDTNSSYQSTTETTDSKAPYKIVKQEYLVNSWISLVGTIGGTLGMFVGFSLIGTFEWVNSFVRKSIFAWLKRRVQKVSKQGTQQVQVEAP